MPPQGSSAFEDALKLGGKPDVQPAEVSLTIRAPEPTASDPYADALKLGGTPSEPNAYGALSKAKTIEPVGMAEKAAEYLPIAGGAIGGLMADIPGAFAGGMLGERVRQYINSLTGAHKLLPAGEAVGEVLKSGAEQGVMEFGGKVVGGALRGPLRPTAPADVAVSGLNKELGLRMTPSMMLDTPMGQAGRLVERASERSMTGRIIADWNRRITMRVAREGIVQGKAALRQVGEELHNVVTAGPGYDMMPHQLEATRVFAKDVAPQVLNLYAKKLPRPLAERLSTAAAGGVTPEVAQKLIPAVRTIIQKGQITPVQTGTLDALESILQADPVVSFESATKLRSALMKIGRKDDIVMGDSGKALVHKFSGELTDSMAQAYPDWDPLRSLYATGSEAQKLQDISAVRNRVLKREGPQTYQQAVREAKSSLLSGSDAHVLSNLRTLDEALRRIGRPGNELGDRIYQTFELVSAATALYKYGPEAAASTAAVTELLPGMVVWAAHNPTMTKLLQEGLTTRDLSKATTILGRVTEAYFTARDQAKKDAEAKQAVGP